MYICVILNCLPWVCTYITFIIRKQEKEGGKYLQILKKMPIKENCKNILSNGYIRKLLIFTGSLMIICRAYRSGILWKYHVCQFRLTASALTTAHTLVSYDDYIESTYILYIYTILYYTIYYIIYIPSRQDTAGAVWFSVLGKASLVTAPLIAC